jgi:endonuclease YncB( thermonuclease family)
VDRRDSPWPGALRRTRRPSAALFAILLTLLLTGCIPGTPSGESDLFEKVVVTQVVDGDTVHVRLASGQAEKVRLIGVDTPEDTTEIERFGAEATAYARQALQGATVYLETDVELRDAYGRLLAYVWLEVPGSDAESDMRELLFNARLLLDGFRPPRPSLFDESLGPLC